MQMRRWQTWQNRGFEVIIMLADIVDLTSRSGRLAPEIHLPSSAKLDLIGFIAEELPLWRDHPDRPITAAETRLTEYLCDHLNTAAYYSIAWSHVQFRAETADEICNGRRIDLTVKPRAAVFFIEGRRHTQFDPLFPIECKRLPTPKEKNRDSREYVTNEPATTGGIQRFKFGYHGAKHNFAAMIAYVQGQSFSHCLAEVNHCIEQLAAKPGSSWLVYETLQPIHENQDVGISIMKSQVERVNDRNCCELRHLWVKMN